MQKVELEKVRNSMRSKYRLFWLGSPYAILNRCKIYNYSSHISFCYLWKGARKRRKWVNRILLSAIFQIYIELESIETMMRKLELWNPEIKCRRNDIMRFYKLHIWIMCIYLWDQKRSIWSMGRKKESNTSLSRNHLETKKWFFSTPKKFPPRSTMRNTMV